MTTRRRFAADFKAKVALEALRGDRTIQGEEDLSLSSQAARDRAAQSGLVRRRVLAGGISLGVSRP